MATSGNGSKSAVEKLILRHQSWIYNIAIRMVFHPQDAEEVTQEVLIKAITRLSTFNGQSKFRTWLYRIATNHVLNMKRRGGEFETRSFSDYGDAINSTPDLDLPDPKTVPVDVPFLVEEAKMSARNWPKIAVVAGVVSWPRAAAIVFLPGGASSTRHFG